MTKVLKRLSWIVLLIVSLVRVGSTSAEGSLSADLNLSESWEYYGDSDGVELGYSVASAGDVNGDGFADVIVGAPLMSGAPPAGVYREGLALVFHGSEAGLPADPNWVTGSGVQGSRYGHAVAGVGDVNGDGFDDVLVGAPDYPVTFGDMGDPKSGKVFLYYGSAAGLSTTPAWTFEAPGRESSLGFSLGPAGDINRDGFADVIIGAPHYSELLDNAGRVYIFHGSSGGLPSSPQWTYDCPQVSATCGYDVYQAGDLNGDGFAEIVIGAPFYDLPDLENAGRVYVFNGTDQGLEAAASWLISGDQAEGWLGYSVATAGDLNADGYADLLVGAPGYSGKVAAAGAVFGYLGSVQGLSPVPDWQAFGSQVYESYGCSVRAAGDLNADGFGDILVGAYRYGENGSLVDKPDEGAVYLFLGTRSGPLMPSIWSATGQKAEAWFGFTAVSAGDVDGDQYVDLLVGAPKYRFDEKTILGQVRLFNGAAGSPIQTVFIPAFVGQTP